jgi:Mg2+ and Co2+ transporter CorA
MIRLMNFAGEVLSAEALRDLDVRCPQGCWIDACEPDDGEITQLRSALALNDLALEDTLQRGPLEPLRTVPRARLPDRPHPGAARPDRQPTERVSMFWTERVLLTMTNEKVPYLELVWRDCQRGRIDRPQQIVHDLLDHAADTFFVHADALHDYVDDLEERVFDGPAGTTGRASCGPCSTTSTAS